MREGDGPREALAHTVSMAQAAEAAGYHRYWIAEHHGHPGIAGSATSVVMGHMASQTQSIRIGAGGIMLPNHSPFVIAEQFGTLDALYPDRIDLGLGRAPGARPDFAHAIRRDTHAAAERFPQDVAELQIYLSGKGEEMGARMIPSPGEAPGVETWILGSSLFGAQLAAKLGLPYSFAAHFAPQLLDEAVAVYRHRFEPSETLSEPKLMVAMAVIGADSDAEAEYLATTLDQAFVAIRTGRPGKLPPPREGYRDTLPPQALAMLQGLGAARAVGSPDTIRQRIAAMVERTGADEIMVSGSVYDPQARIRSLQIAMEASRG